MKVLCRSACVRFLLMCALCISAPNAFAQIFAERLNELTESEVAVLSRDATIRSAISQRYGASALRVLDRYPFTLNYYYMDYGDAQIRKMISMHLKVMDRVAVPSAPTLEDLRTYALLYKPRYRFHADFFTGNWCLPLEWSAANENACVKASPSLDNGIPVYVSYSLRREEQGGGANSVWINYHVFYGLQVGYAAGGRHGNDWEVTSVLIVNGQPSAVRYRVHGSNVSTMPYRAAPLANGIGSGPKVWVGLHTHAGYQNAACLAPPLNILGWNDCRGGAGAREYPSRLIFDCPKDATKNPDACQRFPHSRNQWNEDMIHTKPWHSIPDASFPPSVNFNVDTTVRPGLGQLCYATEAGFKGIVDCVDEHKGVNNLGLMMNDRISSVWGMPTNRPSYHNGCFVLMTRQFWLLYIDRDYKGDQMVYRQAGDNQPYNLAAHYDNKISSILSTYDSICQ
jgi:hypothetical protein